MRLASRSANFRPLKTVPITAVVIVMGWCHLVSPLRGEPVADALSRLFTACHSNNQFNGVCLVAQSNQVIFHRAFGWCDLEKQSANRTVTAFELASISKPITATAILLLVKDGRLNLEDELGECFPGWPYNDISVRHLLTHTAGLPDYRALFATDWDTDKPVSNADIVKRLIERKPPVQFAPGEMWRYSNTGYALLAEVIEKVSRQSYAEFLAQRVFSPAGMKRSSVLPEKPDDMARGYLLTGSGFQPWWMDKHLDRIVGDGGVCCTAEDLYAFSRAFFSGRLLGQELTKEALTPVRLKGGGFQYNGVGGGLGWQLKFVGDDPTPAAAFHTGNYGGFRALLWHDLTQDRTCIQFDNLSHNLDDLATTVQEILEGKPWHLPRKSIQDTLLMAIHREGIDAALQSYRNLKTSHAQDYSFSERELTIVGYILLRQPSVDEAIKVFQLLTEEYPNSFNAFDSLAEAYVAKNNLQDAIRCYEQAVKLNPDYREGLEILSKLRERLAAGKR